MGKRLEITLFGTQYVVGAILLPRLAIQSGVSAYGQKKWHTLIGDVTLGLASKKLTAEVGNVVGHALKPAFQGQGIGMHGRGFGLEVFLGGEFVPVNAVESANRVISPASLMKQCQSGDMLGVFWAQREHAMFYRWEEVGELRQEDVTLAYDSVGALLGKRTPFDLIMDVTWQKKGGRRKCNGEKIKLHSRQYALHKVK